MHRSRTDGNLAFACPPIYATHPDTTTTTYAQSHTCWLLCRHQGMYLTIHTPCPLTGLSISIIYRGGVLSRRDLCTGRSVSLPYPFFGGLSETRMGSVLTVVFSLPRLRIHDDGHSKDGSMPTKYVVFDDSEVHDRSDQS